LTLLVTQFDVRADAEGVEVLGGCGFRCAGLQEGV
jgi:hypothetical protein